ncbi:MAG: TrkA family potassium uptake protein [Coriobacteriaceae bacterium]|nr:TrkA family potassium uptake protein [Coriobacteriaceae bacterium]
MKIVIGGCGRVGALLAQRFVAEGHEVVVVDKDPAALKRLGDGFKGKTIRGMVFDKDVLERAGVDRSDAFIAVTSGDNSNIVSATVARDIYRVPKVVARIFDPRRAEIYRTLGIQTVSSVSWATNEIMSLVMHASLSRDVSLGDGEVNLVRIAVPPRLAGRTVDDLQAPGQIMPVAIVRGGRSFIPASGEQFHEGDIAEVAVLTSSMDLFKRLIHP